MTIEWLCVCVLVNSGDRCWHVLHCRWLWQSSETFGTTLGRTEHLPGERDVTSCDVRQGDWCYGGGRLTAQATSLVHIHGELSWACCHDHCYQPYTRHLCVSVCACVCHLCACVCMCFDTGGWAGGQFNKHLKPRLHDTTCCHTGLTTG